TGARKSPISQKFTDESRVQTVKDLFEYGLNNSSGLLVNFPLSFATTSPALNPKRSDFLESVHKQSTVYRNCFPCGYYISYQFVA
ncbi:unnamed protein product, partial [Schistosoma margrebowiei]